MALGGWRVEGTRSITPPTDGPKQALFGLVWDHPWGGWGVVWRLEVGCWGMEVGGWRLAAAGWRLAFGGGRLEIR